MELNIYHLYPDVLNLYGDRGNVLCMQRRLEWRGMQANIVPVPIGVKLAAKDCDLLFIGGGQDFEQEILMHDLKGEKTAELKAAIEDGVCRDTTMGLTPLDGLMMGTRCGSIDPATVCYLQREGGYTFDEVDEMMNKKSGLLAVTGGKTNDCRNVEELAAAGDPDAQLAFDMFVYKIAAKAAEMATSMCGMDTLVFTAGIGEHAPAVRAGVADRLAFMGVKMDHARNALRGDGAWCLSAKDSKVKIFVIPTDEEFMIASDVERIVNGK